MVLYSGDTLVLSGVGRSFAQDYDCVHTTVDVEVSKKR
jgi:hypothetical protein